MVWLSLKFRSIGVNQLRSENEAKEINNDLTEDKVKIELGMEMKLKANFVAGKLRVSFKLTNRRNGIFHNFRSRCLDMSPV
jgi:hypothetical protein